MSLRSRVEEEFRKQIIKKLSDRGKPFKRKWLDPMIYDNKKIKNLKLNPIKIARIVYPIHSYEIFEMEEEELNLLQENICQKVESYFISKISEDTTSSNFSYVEGDLKISLEYRIAVIEINYNIHLN